MAAAYQAIVAEAEAGINLVSSAYQTLQHGYDTMSSIVAPIVQTPESRKRQHTDAAAAISQATGGSGASQYDPYMGSLVPSQVIRGRGAELPSTSMNYAKSIKFKSGELKGPGYQDPFKYFSQLFKQNLHVSMGFAFKLVLAYPKTNLGVEVPISRFAVHNIFRHNIAKSVNTTAQNGLFGNWQTSWNRSLGPDSSWTRRVGNDITAGTNGSAYVALPTSGNTAYNTTLLTPYRQPQNGGFMYSRLNRQTLENLGWNANPFKLANIPAGNNTIATSTLAILANSALCQDDTLPGTSLPAQAVVDQGVDPSTGGTTPFRYRSQMGTGGLTYNFHNDGTNPVVVDIVVTRIKKNETWNVFANEDNLKNAYNSGYNNYLTNNRGQVNLNGSPPVAYDCMTNSKVPFMPEIALKWYKSPTTTGQSPHPFKQVGRDQFIVASGGSRVWSMELSGVNYGAWDYDTALHGFDDLSYCVSVAVSGVAMPVIEQNSTYNVLPAVVDRRGDACNVSVQGVYHERPYPVYPVQTNSRTFINGVLDSPWYTTAVPAAQSNPQIDIASVAQATRTDATSSSYIVLSPSNVAAGA